MNSGQVKFLEFMSERAQDGKADEVTKILQKSFEEQKKMPLTQETFNKLSEQLLNLVKPEAIEEIKTAMFHFKQNIK